MPELPEVETVRKTLEKKLVGRKILSVEVIYHKGDETSRKMVVV